MPYFSNVFRTDCDAACARVVDAMYAGHIGAKEANDRIERLKDAAHRKIMEHQERARSCASARWVVEPETLCSC